MKWMKWIIISTLLLFSLPLVAQYLPRSTPSKQPEQAIVYASKEAQSTKDVLVFFTHSHESYKPVVKATTGTAAVYDDSLNILSLGQPLTKVFAAQQLNVDLIETDLMATMQLSNSKFYQAYDVARPFIEAAIAEKPYDLVLDIHRDSAAKASTTLTNKQGSFAKIALVIGLENPMYAWNLAYAEQLDAQLNALMPGISRGIVKKEGEGVDGVYNQDLANEMLLVEVGGIDNTEAEVLQTIEVLAEAIRQLLNEEVNTTIGYDVSL